MYIYTHTYTCITLRHWAIAPHQPLGGAAAPPSSIEACAQTYLSLYIYIYNVCMCMCMCMYMYICIYIYISIYIYIASRPVLNTT